MTVSKAATAFIFLLHFGEKLRNRYKQMVISVFFYSLVWLLRKLPSDRWSHQWGWLQTSNMLDCRDPLFSVCSRVVSGRGAVFCRHAEQHYRLAAQILVSHSNDDSLSHTMLSASFQPLYNFRPIGQQFCAGGLWQPQTPWSYLIVPSWNTEEKTCPAAIILQNVHFFSGGAGGSCTQIHTHKHTISWSQRCERACTPLCTSWLPPEKMFSTCHVAAAASQPWWDDNKTINVLLEMYLMRNASGNVAASVRDLQLLFFFFLFFLCYRLKITISKNKRLLSAAAQEF